MTKTYTPLLIEGKIYVVVDAPAKPIFSFAYYPIVSQYSRDKRIWEEKIAACTKYETLPEHAPYWKERIGKRVEGIDWQAEADFNRGITTYAIPPQKEKNFYCTNHSSGYGIGQCENQCGGCKVIVENRQSRTKNMAIPPQQKQGDEDEQVWLDLISDISDWALSNPQMKLGKFIPKLRKNYSITKK